MLAHKSIINSCTWFSRILRSSSSTFRVYLYQNSSDTSSRGGSRGSMEGGKCRTSSIGDDRLNGGGALSASVERVTSVRVKT